MAFRSLDLDRRYDTYVSPRRLVEEFYQPVLAEAERYDRIAGYFSASALTAAADGIEAFARSGGMMRLLIGVVDRDTREQIIRGDNVTLGDRPTDDEARLRQWLLGYLLNEGRLEVKVAVPSRGNGIFHAKLGCLYDGDENILTFEGSLNETAGGWMANYERFKIHRSWRDVEEAYVRQDVEDFETLWNGDSSAVDVYDLSEAAEGQIADWSDTTDPDDPDDVDECVERVADVAEQRDERIATAGVLRNARQMPGAVTIGDATCTLENVWPHQRVIADTLVNAYPRNFLLCDEVGLGKTIEAGLTASRLIKGGIASNGLILPRAGLEKQWQSELWENFTLNSFIYNRHGDTVVFEDALGRTFEYPFDAEDGAVWAFLQGRDEPTIVIMSWHTARLSSHREEIILPRETREGDPGEMSTTDSAFGIWDFAIVDEVHSARPETEFLNLLSPEYGDDPNGLVECVQALYLLTATPLQVDLAELHRLVSLLNVPEEWTDEEKFVAFFRWKQAFEEAIERHDIHGLNDLIDSRELAEDRSDISEALYDVVGPLCRAMADRIDGYEETVDELQREAGDNGDDFRELFSVEYPMFRSPPPIQKLSMELIKAAVALMDFATPIETRLFRNTRDTLDVYTDAGLLDATVADRNVKTIGVETTAEIDRAFDQIEDYVREAYYGGGPSDADQRQAIGFVLTTYRKRLASSVQAFKETLESRRATVEEKMADTNPDAPEQTVDEQIEDAVTVDRLDTDEYRDVLQRELDYIDDVERAIGDIRGVDPKFKQLKNDIETLILDHGRFIIFSQYTDTMEAVRDFLHENGYDGRVGTYSSDGGRRYDSEEDRWVDVGHGGIKTAFKSNDDPVDILVCTEAASEGLNLQECGVLINFDCPWNPTRIEQRIGRIDRIGQNHDPIEIRNYIYEDTIEENVYRTLDENKEMFESAVGEMQDILDTASSEIRRRVRGDTVHETVADSTPSASPLREELEDTSEAASREEVVAAAQKPLAMPERHPSIRTPGRGNPESPPVSPSAVGRILLDDRFLSTLGISRATLTDGTHRLKYDGDKESPPTIGEQVVVAERPTLARNEGVRLFAPGDPLFNWLRDEYVDRFPEAHKQYVGETGARSVHLNPETGAVRLAKDGSLSAVGLSSRWSKRFERWVDDTERNVG